ncbi:MAG: L,D-transpeptidase [Acetobacteraceae bacterium]|nr:L,D-transpeptidase [Acetobacteraceae bacterium]
MMLRTVAALFAALIALPALAAAPDDPALTVEVLRLQQSFQHEVRHAVLPDAARARIWTGLARAALAEAGVVIDHPQLVVVVDRNPRVQQLMIMVASASDSWPMVGGGAISTGQTGRFDHYVTPAGVFHVTDAILGYRAEGTLNENGIRGLGAKGMRVWDFGWQVAKKGWPEVAGKPDSTPIRFMLHATDPDKLEQRLGHPASQGCIRMPATLNRYLDRHGVIDAEYERAAATEIRFRALLLADREPSLLAGDTLIVVDSGPPPTIRSAAKAAPDPRRSEATGPKAGPGRS